MSPEGAGVRAMPPGVKSKPADWMSTVPVGAAEPVFPVTVIDKLMRAAGEAEGLLAVAVVVEDSSTLGAVMVSIAAGDAVVPLL